MHHQEHQGILIVFSGQINIEPWFETRKVKNINLPNGLEKSKFMIALGFKNSVSCLNQTRMTGVS